MYDTIWDSNVRPKDKNISMKQLNVVLSGHTTLIVDLNKTYLNTVTNCRYSGFKVVKFTSRLLGISFIQLLKHYHDLKTCLFHNVNVFVVEHYSGF